MRQYLSNSTSTDEITNNSKPRFRHIIALSAVVLSTSIFASPSIAAIGDDPAAVIATRTGPGEFAVVVDGPNGFRVVNFFNNGDDPNTATPVSSIESGTTNIGVGNANNIGGKEYAETSAFLNEPFIDPQGPLNLFDLAIFLSFRVQAAVAVNCENLEKRLQEARAERQRLIDFSVSLLNQFGERQNKISRARSSLNRLKARLNANINEKIKREIRRAIDSVERIIAENTRLLERQKRLNRETNEKLIKNDQLIERIRKTLKKCKDASITPTSARVVMPTASNPNISALASGGRSLPWSVFAQGSYSGLDDNRTGAKRDADIFSLVVGGTLNLSDATSVGASLTFKDGKVKSTSLLSNLKGTYYGINVFAKQQLSEVISLIINGGYTHGNNNVNLNGARGKFNTNVFTGGASLQGRFHIGQLLVSPDVSAQFSAVKNNGFIASNAVVTPSQKHTTGAIAFGGKISRVFNDGSDTSFTPFLGIHGVYSLRTGNKLALINGVNIGETGFGVKFDAGVNIKTSGGISTGVTGSYSVLKKLQSYSISANVQIPFN